MVAVDNDQFALETRLMVYVRRNTGRIVDLQHFRKNPIYAEEMLTLAENTGDADIRRIVTTLRSMIGVRSKPAETAAEIRNEVRQRVTTPNVAASNEVVDPAKPRYVVSIR